MPFKRNENKRGTASEFDEDDNELLRDPKIVAKYELQRVLEERLDDLSNRRCSSVAAALNIRSIHEFLSQFFSAEISEVFESLSYSILDAVMGQIFNSSGGLQRRGPAAAKPEDQICALNCLSAFLVQVSSTDRVPIDMAKFADLMNGLIGALADHQLNADVCDSVAQVLAVGDLMINEDVDMRQRLVDGLNHSSAGCVRAWALSIPSYLSDDQTSAVRSITRFFAQCGKLLDSGSLRLRSAACDALAVVAEQSRAIELDDIWIPEHVQSKVIELAKESNKRVAKKELHLQHCAFGQLEQYLKNGEFEAKTIKMPKNSRKEFERGEDDIQHPILIDTFHKQLCQNLLKDVLGSQLIVHLKRNAAIRAMLGADNTTNDTLEESELETSGYDKKTVQHLRKEKTFLRDQSIKCKRDNKHEAASPSAL